jgi:hypothetical protein
MKNPTKELMAIPPEDWLEEADRRERAGDKQGAKTARQFARFLMGQKDAFTNPSSRNAMNSEGLQFIWVLEKDGSAYLHVYKSLQKATSALNTFSKIKRGAIDPSIGRAGSRGISQLGHGIGNSKMTVDDIAASVEKKYGVEPEVIRHDLANNPVRRHKGESERKFVSRCMSEEKMSFPKQKQRIAVCLSKARKNPFNDRNLDA